MPAWVLPAALAVGQLIGSWISQSRQKRHNASLAATQAAANEEYLDRTNSYNSPVSQMARYKAAGLNPHLVYTQGNPGTSANLSYPDIANSDQGGGFDQLATNFRNNSMAMTQMAATEAKTAHTITLNEVAKTQNEVLKKNPLLDNAGFNAVIDGLVATAQLKEQQLVKEGINIDILNASSGHIVNKIFNEVKNLEQQFGLMEVDKKVRAEILSSKRFQNEILEVQKRFMTDGDVTPQHVLFFIQSLLLKLAGGFK